jgi:UDP-N-acetylmuramoyl-L-alanyl-D-glutamate--2,6-diaminopimelate ligase
MAIKKNSKDILPGDTYLSILGKKSNGNDFVAEAIKNGAEKIILEKKNPLRQEILSLLSQKNITYEYVENGYLVFAQATFEKNPTTFQNLIIIGITGTKGKTSLTFLVYSLLMRLGYKTAMMSSAFHEINGIREQATLTTENQEVIQEFVTRAKKSDITHLVLEVSAHAFSQYRIYGIEFDLFIFNNFSQEHAEYYETQDEYFQAKIELYRYLKKDGGVVLSYDDAKIYATQNKLLPSQHAYGFSSKNSRAYTYSHITSQNIFQTNADIFINKKTYHLSTRLLGTHNINNIAAALTTLSHFDYLNEKTFLSIHNFLETIPDVPGRGERYFLKNGTIVYIDKSYTTNSIATVLDTLRPLTSHLVVVFGCGGERDSFRRPQIAHLIESIADSIYVAPDNPRYEEQTKIFQDIARGFSYTKNIYFFHERKDAILSAIQERKNEKIVVLLGKGDEQYQEVKGVKYYFSEKSLFIDELKQSNNNS